MKKSILLLIALCIGMYANSQTKSKIPAHLLNKTEKMMPIISGEEIPIIINEGNPFLTPSTSRDLGTPIGITYYDLQGNSDVGNRMMVYADGSVTAVWTIAPNSSAGYPDRGSGYNHSTNGGTSWGPQPTARIEDVKTGWPAVGRTTNSELVVSHFFETRLNMAKTTNNGTNWENFPFAQTEAICWPRMVSNGNTVHVIGQTKTTVPYGGFTTGALVYLKSTDGGTNWTAPVIPTGLDTSNYAASSPFSDSYSMTCKGDTVAILYGDGFRTTCLVKSTNAGNTWSYKEILHLPKKKFDTEGSAIYDINGDNQQDNCYGNDGVNFVTLDKTGKAHVFFGRMNYTDDGAGAGYNYYPYTDGLYYWNEDMGTIQYQYRWTMIGTTNTYEGIPDTVNFPIITEVYDIDNSGEIELPDNGSNVPFGPYYCSLSSQPNAAISPDGCIYLFYSSLVENTDGTVGSEHRAFRNIWMIHKTSGQPNNFIWSNPPIRIAEDDFTEQVWPCVGARLTGIAPDYFSHLWYQGDGYPGNALQPNTANPHGIVENTIYFKKTEFYINNINEINNLKALPSIYPNPASKNVTVSYNLTEATNVTLGIYNMVGQQILTTSQNVTAGDVKITLNIESLPQGVYFIKSDIGDKTYTNKLVVE